MNIMTLEKLKMCSGNNKHCSLIQTTIMFIVHDIAIGIVYLWTNNNCTLVPFYRELLFCKGQMLSVFPLQFDQLISESLRGLSKMIDILEYDILTNHQLNRHV